LIYSARLRDEGWKVSGPLGVHRRPPTSNRAALGVSCRANQRVKCLQVRVT
jgi:hypothetical protein